MNGKILDSKIQIPIRFRNFIARDDLFSMLEEAHEKVVVLNAGAGFGKTMLLTYYAVESDNKCAWYHLSSLDNDIMNFIKYLSYSLNKVISDFKFVYDNQSSRHSNELIESLAIDFSIYVSQFSDYKISILLDDFQEIYNEEIYNFLSIVINNSSENIKFFIATKGSFPKFLARYMLQGSAFILNDKKLVFNKNEIMTILNDTTSINDIETCADFILDYTEGWPAGVVAIVLSLKNDRKTFQKDEIVALCKESKVYDYFMYEIFKKLPYDIQTFLIHTSVLNILSADLCNAVMNTNTAKGTLDYLVQENIFIVMLSGKGNVYRYHSIFKDYLSMQISKNVEQIVLRKAALYCLNRGEYEQAIEYSIQSNDSELMQSGFELIGNKMIKLGEMLTMNRWVDFLNQIQSILSAKTKMIMSSYYYNNNNQVRAYELIVEACTSFELEDNENDLVEGVLLKVSYLKEQGDLNTGRTELEKVLGRIKRIYNVNWYVVSAMRMELNLLLMKEAEAVEIATEIITGNTLSIRGDKETVVNNIKDSAQRVTKIAKLHLRNEIMDENDCEEHSQIVAAYCSWCMIQYFYIQQNKEMVEFLINKYFSQLRQNHTFTLYIKIIQCIYLLHEGQTEETSSLMLEANKYFRANEIEFPKILKEDEKLIKGSDQLTPNRNLNNKLYIKCFDNGLTYYEQPEQEINWRTKKTYELFAYLFDRQGKAVSKDSIISVLWPDMPMDKSGGLFHTTLSYLRRALLEFNLGDLIQSKNSGYSIDIESVENDYELLMNIYQKVQMGHFTEIEEPERLIEIYKNSYFNNISSEWVVNKREHLERVYIVCCKLIVQEMMKRKRYAECSAILSKIVRLDPYSEELLAMLLKVYGAVGDLRSVKNHYEEAKKVLKEELDIDLSDEIEKLYSDIIRRKK